MKTTISNIKTTLVTSDDGVYTYSITKTLEDVEGDKAIIVLLYPTRTKENINGNDTTVSHLIAHMQDMNLSEITIINLFSKVVKAKLSAKGLTVDESNMQYIENEIMNQKDFKAKKFILAYGSSMQTCEACEESKKRILELFRKYNTDGTVYQLTTGSMPNEDCPHPLWLGIRCRFSKWYLTECINLPEKAVEESKKNKRSKKVKDREIIILK